MEKYQSNSEQETKKIAENFAKQIKGNIFALSGDLGAGKTIFAQGFAKGLGIKEKIISPTFVLIRQHQIPASPTQRGEPNSNKIFYHIDLYRLEQTENITQLGLKEIWSDPNNIVLIEWAEKIENFLPKNTVKIVIEKIENHKRQITIE